MRAFVHSSAVALLAGAVSFGTLGFAMAGADDGGSKAFFSSTDAGSARGAGPQVEGQTKAAPAQPAAAVERRAARPRVAAAHAVRERAPHVAVARREAPHRTVTAERRAAPHGTLHAMHRAPGAPSSHT